MLHIQRLSLNGLLASRQNNTTSLGRCGSASIPTLFRPRAACDYLQLLARSARVRYNTTLAEINVLTLRVAWRRPSPRRSTCMRSTAGKADVMTQSNSTSSRSLSYTAYEGNSWEVTFAQSGLSGSAASVPVPYFRISAMQILHIDLCRCDGSGGPLARRGPCLCKSDMAIQRAKRGIERCQARS